MICINVSAKRVLRRVVQCSSTAAWLAQLVERRTSVRELEDLHSGS